MKNVLKIGTKVVKGYVIFNTGCICFCYLSTIWKRLAERFIDTKADDLTITDVFTAGREMVSEDMDFGVMFAKSVFST